VLQRTREARASLRPRNLAAWAHDRRSRSAYRHLSGDEVRATRRSDTVFICGSGRSVLEIAPDEWRRMEQHDVAAFSRFQYQHFVRVDYHMIAEVEPHVLALEDYARMLRENPFYAETVFVVQEGLMADNGNSIVGKLLLPPGARVFRYRRISRGRYSPPSRAFRRGLVHGWNTSISVTNFALLMGWRRIVIVGVDLYDKGYFFLPEGVTGPGEEEGITARSRFPNADNIVATFGRWREVAARDGIELLVYNPRSLLADVLEVFRWDAEAEPATARGSSESR
jgi:hypothetical protein